MHALGMLWQLVFLLAPPIPATLLEKAETSFDNMEYPAALRLADQVLSSSASGPADLARAFRIKGLCLSGLGKTEAALDAFESLLSLDPNAEMSSDLSPKLTAPFYQALARARAGKPLRLVHEPPPPSEVLGGKEIIVRVESDPKRLVKKLRVVFQCDREENEQRLERAVSGTGETALPLPAKLRAREVRYRVEALTAAGGVLYVLQDGAAPYRLRVGLPGAAATASGPDAAPAAAPRPTAAEPLALPPPQNAAPTPPAPAPRPDREKDERATPWYQSWWFWTAVGVVVAGAATGVAVGVSSSGGSGPADYGIRIP